ncbi:hypothetical protein BAUCODRAFT_138136 [Baudoinia panamericana UAMH 10762]|uniref:RING-type domain-containing protein n=1 Tax=Baudoinia panamericana (strain UAMH 10762) TaxID=717646 RepID=M2NH83_BAUPA|nr:uncharacterized protein BAUCODRAFT_138136 [Baudoinia panamericana UAMH 10762]EMC98385.1 hypothetical protein BAUCODRAFT_138136 [Baudoinia panamericana UAMH 10762]
MEVAIQGAFSNRNQQPSKRSYSAMNAHNRSGSPDSLFIPSDDHYTNEHAARRPRLALPPMRTTPPPGLGLRRFPGDGYDFRRPVMSTVTSAAPVIDLTDEDIAVGSEMEDARAPAAAAESSHASRLPRFGGRNIFAEVSDDIHVHRRATPSEPERAAHPRLAQLRAASNITRSLSPVIVDDDELEIISERTLPDSQRTSRHPSPVVSAPPRSLTPYPADMSVEPIDLTADDDVVHLNTRPRAGAGLNAARPGATAGVGTRSEAADEGGFHIGPIWNMLRTQGVDMNGRLPRFAQRFFGRDAEPEPALFDELDVEHLRHLDHLRRHQYRPAHDRLAVHQHGRNAAPGVMAINMDYGAAAFDLGYGVPAPERPASPYVAPEKPEKGFTRNPGEEDVVVCPNCGDELAVSEDEVKQQVWIVKTCGHAYCGDCAQKRLRKVSKKGKQRATEKEESLPAPWSTCVVKECGAKATKSAVIQVYLGS